MSPGITIGDVSRRTGVAASALRYYESRGLISSTRSESGQRRYRPDAVRRISFIKVAQQVGLTLEEIATALHSLPRNRTPTEADWRRIATAWRPRLEARIALLERLRDRLDSCIGCGCLSLRACRLLNPSDEAGERGPGPRYLIDPDPPPLGG